MPRVSVIIPSYNHARFIAEAIQSVLAQSYQDFEIVITDDASSDTSVEIIKTFDDPRIKLFCFEENCGAAAATNHCIAQASGEYISLLNSDDIFLFDKLDKQVSFLDSHPDIAAVFAYPNVIDENGRELRFGEHPSVDWFEQPNRSRFEWLHFLFSNGNHLCHPTVVIRKECYADGAYDVRLWQTPDYDFWIRLCSRYSIWVIPEKLIKLRIRDSEANASGQRPETRIRSALEYKQCLRNYLKPEILKDVTKIFPHLYNYGELLDEPNYSPLLVGLEALKIQYEPYADFAFDIFYDFFNRVPQEVFKIAKNKYGFGLGDLVSLSGQRDVFNLEKILELKLQLDQLSLAQAELTQAQAELAQTEAELAQTEAELAQTQAELAQTQAELAQTQAELAQTQERLSLFDQALVAIRTSKFWRLRDKWFQVKRRIGLPTNDTVLEELSKIKLPNPVLNAYQVKILNPIQSQRYKIVHAIPNFMTGGSSRLVVDLVECLGHYYEQEIITSYIPSPPNYTGIKIHEYNHVASSNDIFKYLKIASPKILHIHYWGDCDAPWYAKVFSAAEKLGCIVVENINTPIEPYLSKCVRKYVYVSDYVRQQFGLDQPEHLAIYPGSSLDLFSRSDKSEIPDDCIGMVYRLEKDKLNEQSIDVFIKVAQQRSQTKILIVGGGTFLEAYRVATVQAGVASNFTFTGYVPYEELPALYEKMSIFVAPVWKESFGQVGPFAMSMEIPVVGYQVGGLAEIVNNPDLLAPAGDSQSLAQIIIELLDNREIRLQIGATNRQRFQDFFSLDAMINHYSKLYQELLEET